MNLLAFVVYAFHYTPILPRTYFRRQWRKFSLYHPLLFSSLSTHALFFALWKLLALCRIAPSKLHIRPVASATAAAVHPSERPSLLAVRFGWNSSNYPFRPTACQTRCKFFQWWSSGRIYTALSVEHSLSPPDASEGIMYTVLSRCRFARDWAGVTLYGKCGDKFGTAATNATRSLSRWFYLCGSFSCVLRYHTLFTFGACL